MGSGAGCQRKRIVNSLRGARAVFSFQLIILLEQFRLLERKEERLIYIKISPSPSRQDSSLCVDTVVINYEGRGVGVGGGEGVYCPRTPKRQAHSPTPTASAQSVYCSLRRPLPYRH